MQRIHFFSKRVVLSQFELEIATVITVTVVIRVRSFVQERNLVNFNVLDVFHVFFFVTKNLVD